MLKHVRREYNHNEDDSPFVSIADFFSLISLAFIYMAVMFGSPKAKEQPVEVSQAAAVGTGSGPVAELDPSVAYISLFPQTDNILLRIVPAHNAPVTDKRIHFPIAIESTTEWVLTTLANTSHPERVILYLPSDEKRSEVHSLVLNLSAKLSPDYRLILLVGQLK